MLWYSGNQDGVYGMGNMTTHKENVTFTHVEDLGGLEVLQARYHRQTFSRHSHENFCVGVINEGAQSFYRTGGTHIAPQDSIILVNADDIHTGRAATENGWSYHAMYPSAELLASLSKDMKTTAGATPYFPEAVVYDPMLALELRQSFKLLSIANNKLLKESVVFSALARLMMKHAKTSITPPVQINAQSQVLRVRSFLDDCPEENISLLELSSLVSLSPYYLLRQFQKMTGLPPHAYQIQARLRKSRTLLKHGCSILETAMLLGFHDQSHFHRHFKKSMGITPKEYVKNLLPELANSAI
ncbi:AraC family transcriptional regulator [Pragia fontium]|uniref:AraC family transcriptional regulator n=1 Tax=Pragia fontium TaxID=82985 RepID=UPI000AF98C63|nr:AraC family transcriptional regulator [Pragia fontium]